MTPEAMSPTSVLGFEEIHPPLSREDAILEAERCLQCGGPGQPAPCTVACPAQIDIPRFIKEIKQDELIEAAETIFASNSMGGSCGRVCPTQVLCEGSCVMSKEGRRPVEIGRLQRFATDYALETAGIRKNPAPRKIQGKSVSIVGAGPAGFACAEELACLGYDVTIYEKRPLPGGLVTYGIAPYKQRVDPILQEAERLQGLGVTIEFGVEFGKDVLPAQLGHSALFLGVGMGADTPAGLPGEDLPGVWESLAFIEEVKLGDPGSLFLGNKLVVIGGGNTAIDVAREAVRLGVDELILVYRRDEDAMPAYRHEVEAAKAEGVKFMFLTAPVRFVGEHSVTGIECLQMQLGEPDASGRPQPVPIEGSEFTIYASTVVKAIGQQPLQELFDSLDVNTKKGRPVVGETFQTSNPKVFAGGDTITGGCTVVESVRHGRLAARGIHSFLTNWEFRLPEAPRDAEIEIRQEGPFLKHHQGDYYVGTSAKLCKGCNLCIESCPVDILSLDQKNKIVVNDVASCVFCGMCEMRCPDFAIWVNKDAGLEHPVEIEARRRLTL
jgi:glutamate synthase (NADPH/NADH) small chain